ncbi:uncharacterized protein LOC136092867 [Hydra vulgaris]|uniref:uncharacterized protein LOC136092867 n=1 Tax=Hydra vulgaris TaxID=6087 RepID=UPI0032EA359D
MSSNLRAENRRNCRYERNVARREEINPCQNERNEARREAINRRQIERNEARREEINRRQNERNEARRVLLRRGMHCVAKNNVIIERKVVLPPLSPYPPLMVDLMTGNHVDRALNQNFFKNIRNYNACLSFASFIATIDTPSNRGPPCFRTSRQVMHRIGNLRHKQGDPPAYCQLYVYDSNTALNFRIEQNDCCIRELMELLQTIIIQENPYALSFKNMAEVEDAKIRQAAIEDRPISVVKMSLLEGCDKRQYSLPSHEEVAIVFVGNDGAPPPSIEVVIYPRGQPLKIISSMSANLDPMIYPILFPRGDQNKLRSEQYDTLHEYVNNVANNFNVKPGRVVIIPASYVGSPRAFKRKF